MPSTHPSQADVAAAYRTLIAHETEPKEQDFYRTRLQRLEPTTEPESDDFVTQLAVQQIEGEAAWWRSIDFGRNASRTFESMTGDSQQAVRTGVERVLAHLQFAGRLIPAAGMSLTAEQVEDVRKLSQMDPWWSAEHVEEVQARLRALFPATEPAEECAAEYVERTRRFQSTTPPAPAEPAEEETKAECLSRWDELRCGLDAGHAGSHEQGKCSDPDWAIWPGDHANPTTSAESIEEEAMLAARGEGWYEGYEVGLEYGPIAASGEEYDGPINPYDMPASSPVVEEETKAEVWDAGFEAGYDHAGCEHTPSGISIDPPLNPYDERNARYASSPVVPAPTETGPWQTLQEVPEGVTRVVDSECELWVQEGGQWFSICQLHNPAEFAPFVAAEEG